MDRKAKSETTDLADLPGRLAWPVSHRRRHHRLHRPGCYACMRRMPDQEQFVRGPKQQYQRALIVELCMPGTYYMECVWHRQEICQLEMPMAVVYCTEPPMRPGQTHRDAVLECVLFAHLIGLHEIIVESCRLDYLAVSGRPMEVHIDAILVGRSWGPRVAAVSSWC